MTVAKMKWGDAEDEDDTLPPRSETGPDAKGIKTIIDYKKNEKGEVVKMISRTRVTTVKRTVYEVVAVRRNWARFGDAVKEQVGEAVTVQCPEEIPFERIRQSRQTQEEKKANDLKTALQGSDKSQIVGSLKDLLYKRRMERQLAQARGQLGNPEMPPMDDERPGVGGASNLLPAAGSKGGYVPPSIRNRMAGGDGESMRRREENSVRVTNLSEDTREDDLRELFSPFGQISRIYIAYDRETGENRGFAFVNFMHREDAQRAIERLDGYGYDNLILRVELAAPRPER